MKNHVFSPAIRAATILFVVIAAFVMVCDVHAHDDHNQTFGEFTDVYLTGYHIHDRNEARHRHAVRGTVSNHPRGIVHNELDLWQEHLHEMPAEDNGTYLLPLYSVSGSAHIHDERSHIHVVLYSWPTDADVAAEILQKLDSQEIDHDVESDVYTLQYIWQHIDSVSSIEHRHNWKHKHGVLGWHVHNVRHSHVYSEGDHPDWFSNNPGDDSYPAGTFLNDHEVLHPSDEDRTVAAPSKYKTLTLRWAELKMK